VRLPARLDLQLFIGGFTAGVDAVAINLVCAGLVSCATAVIEKRKKL
jgi:hypothetical protein